MQADADAEVVAREIGIALDAALHVGRGEQAVQRARKRAHDLVADRLDDAPAVTRGDFGQRDQHAADDAHRRFVAARLEKLGRAGDVGEQDRECAALGHGAADDRLIGANACRRAYRLSRFAGVAGCGPGEGSSAWVLDGGAVRTRTGLPSPCPLPQAGEGETAR